MRPLSLLALVVLSAGCARASHVPAQTPETLAATVRGPIRTPVERAEIAERNTLKLAPVADARKPGDFVVHRFSGAFRKTPLRLTEKVVAVEGSLVTVELTLAAETKKIDPNDGTRLRVLFDRTPGATREVAKVTRLVGDREEPGTLEDYEKLMAETIVVPDRNDDTIGSEVVTAQVGEHAIDCKKTSYKVAIGKKTGVLSTLTADGFAWGDVGGEIKTDDGKLLYRAEVVEAGNGGAGKATASR